MYDWSSRVCGSMIWYSSSTPIVRDGGFIVGSSRKVCEQPDGRRQRNEAGRRQTAVGRRQRLHYASRFCLCLLPAADGPLPASVRCPLPSLHNSVMIGLATEAPRERSAPSTHRPPSHSV